MKKLITPFLLFSMVFFSFNTYAGDFKKKKTTTIIANSLNMAVCDAPTNVAHIYSNDVTTFSWNAVSSASYYEIELDWNGVVWPGQFADVAPNHIYSITGLMQGGDFQMRVRAICQSGPSAWSATYVFLTDCSIPSSQSTGNITSNSAVFNWVPAVGNNGNTVFSTSYRVANTNNAWTSLPNTSGTSVSATGLAASTIYEWRVRKICSAACSDLLTTQFVTSSPAGCGVPTNVTASNIATRSATISWALIGGASKYDLQYKLSTSNNWSTKSNISSFSYYLTNLSANKEYDLRVRAKCGNGYSAYSLESSFTTTANFSSRPDSPEWTESPTSENMELKEIPAPKKSGIAVRQNPSEGRFVIDVTGDVMPVRYEVFSLNGTLAAGGNIMSAKQFNVDITHMPAGTYLLRVTNSKGVQTALRLVKSR